MRLINTQTGRFEEFIGLNIPGYAILSHTWEDGEVSYRDMINPQPSTSQKHQKIEMTCQLARQANLDYAWIDTCCIDKSSSAELTEAINSMYRWYARATVCFVFLSDLGEFDQLDLKLPHCRWFTRGWTLQELIAPGSIVFFDRAWQPRGTKADMVDSLSEITSVNVEVLRHETSLSALSVAQKMSWAAQRETTRVEDLAYCLLGVFNINMPLLYGEQERAFRRLQEEIIKSTPDLSIFAWKLPQRRSDESELERRVFCGVLADRPAAFAGAQSFVKSLQYARREFSVTNIGVKTYVQILSQSIHGRRAFRYVLPLDCRDRGKELGIILRKCGPDKFLREDQCTILDSLAFCTPNAARERYLLTKLPDTDPATALPRLEEGFSISQTRSNVLRIQLSPHIEIYDAWPWGRYDDEDQLFFVHQETTWDSAMLRLIIDFQAKVGRRTFDIRRECAFYAVGWSSSDLRDLQCSIVDYQDFYLSLSEVQSQNSTWEHNSSQVIQTLAYHSIPKSPYVAVDIPGSGSSLLVSFKLEHHHNSSLCLGNVWNVHLDCEVLERKRLPPPRTGKWQLLED
jgi:hypothetical protein